MFQKILIPVDFSTFTEEACLMATQFSGAQFELTHAICMADIIEQAPSFGANIPSDFQERLMASAQEKLTQLKNQHPSLAADTSLSIGPVADEICKRAREINADLIIIPTHGKTGLKHILMGSVAEHVVRHASCAVLIFLPEQMKD